MKHLTYIEPLEDRIAPATIINPYTVTFQDADGDTAVVKISKPLFKNAKAAEKILIFSTNNGSTESFGGNSVGESLSEINLLGRTDAQDMNISVSVLPMVGVGNASVDVGSIQAANFSIPNQVTQNIDLGHVSIQGNLGFINAGDNFSTPAIQSLTVGSMSIGEQSNVLGPITKMTVKGNFNANLQEIGYQFGSIGSLFIGGSLAGDSAGDQGTGVIQFTGHIGSATIGNIAGSTVSSNTTGELIGTSSTPTTIGTLHVLGSITGGAGQDSGRVFAQSSIGKVIVDGSVVGGSGQDSGEIAGPLGSVHIKGSLNGGSGTSSGTVLSEATGTTGAFVPVPIGNVTIGGDVVGGTAGVAASGSTGATAGNSGIISASSAQSITIAGSLTGGSSGDTNGSVLVNSVKTLTIGGNITGEGGSRSGIVTGQGFFSTMKYGSITVYGDVAGGAGATSGDILVNGLLGGSIANLHIFGNLTGAAGTQSGEVYASTGLTKLAIDGNITGGTANDTGKVFTGGSLGNAIIGGNLTGNTTINSTTAVVGSGYIEAGHIGTLMVGGNVTSGSNAGTGGIANSGAIRSSADITSLSIAGQVTGTKANPVVISATQGPGNSAHPKTDLAIGRVTIDKAVTYLDLLAGYNPTVSTGSSTPAGAPLGTPTDGTAQIGTVTFKSTLSASNVVAGATPDSNGQFGTAGNMAIPPSPAKKDLMSSIASIIVDGQATGDSTPTDSFGFVAESLDFVSVHGVNGGQNLATGLVPGTPVAVDSTNLHLLEVPKPS